MSRPRKIAYHPEDAPADVSAAFGVPDDFCRRIAANDRKAALLDRLPVIARAIDDRDTFLRVLDLLAAG